MLRLESGWIVVHAGFECDGTPPEDQKLNRVCRIRDLDVKGKRARNKKDFFSPADGSEIWDIQWDRMYGRNPGVIYGHAVHSLKEPRTKVSSCCGIDTGCVYGGRLTAWIGIDGNHDFVQVDAKRQYFKPPRGWRVGGPTSSLD